MEKPWSREKLKRHLIDELLEHDWVPIRLREHCLWAVYNESIQNSLRFSLLVVPSVSIWTDEVWALTDWARHPRLSTILPKVNCNKLTKSNVLQIIFERISVDENTVCNPCLCLRSLQPLFTKLAKSHISAQFFIRVFVLGWYTYSETTQVLFSLCFQEKRV